MSPRRLLLLAFLCLAYGPAAWPAGDDSDDLLAPLTPAEGKGKKKKKKVPPATGPTVEKKKEAPPPPVEPLPSLSMGRLSVRLPDPSMKNARLYVDDREIGVLPQEPVDETPGDHKVTVKRLGYAPFNATVKVKDTGVTELMAILEPLAAVVTFTSDIVGVEVFVDGKSYGPVPVNDVVIAPGSHQFRGKKDGYDEQNQTMSLKAGQDYTVRLSLRLATVARADRPERPKNLEPKPTAPDGNAGMSSAVVEREREEGGTPFYGQWYFWAGAGAVAAGAAGGTLYAMQPKNPCGDRPCDACINAPPNLQQFCSGLVHLPLFVGFGGPVGSPARH